MNVDELRASLSLRRNELLGLDLTIESACCWGIDGENPHIDFDTAAIELRGVLYQLDFLLYELRPATCPDMPDVFRERMDCFGRAVCRLLLRRLNRSLNDGEFFFSAWTFAQECVELVDKLIEFRPPADLITHDRAGEITGASAKTISRRVADGILTRHRGNKVSEAEVLEKKHLLLKRQPRGMKSGPKPKSGHSERSADTASPGAVLRTV